MIAFKKNKGKIIEEEEEEIEYEDELSESDKSLDLKYLPSKKVRKKKAKFEFQPANDTHQVVRSKNLKV